MNEETTFLMRGFGVVVTLFAGAFGLGKYNANIVKKKGTYIPSGTSRYKGTLKNKGTMYGSVKRSKTFSGIAQAMADQWGALLV